MSKREYLACVQCILGTWESHRADLADLCRRKVATGASRSCRSLGPQQTLGKRRKHRLSPLYRNPWTTL